MRLTILFLIMSVFAFAQINKITPSNVKYIESFINKDSITVIYLHGAGERGNDLNTVKRVSFYTKFYAANKTKYNIFIPQQTTASWSWIYPIRSNGEPYGVEFIRWVTRTYGLDPKRIVLTGHSMGSSWVIAELMPDELGAIAPVSGSGNYQGCVKLGQIKMPVMAFHGESDRTSPNDFASGKKACITWYQNIGGGSPKWVTYPGVGHGADSYAYASNSGLKEWIDSLFPPVIVKPVPKVKDMVDSIYTYPGDSSVYFLFKSKRVIKK